MGWVIIILLVIIVAVVAFGIGGYNGLVRARNLIEESWRQVDVELNRRYELLPNLVETVKGYASHERGTLEEVIRLRNQAASLAGQGQATQQRAEVEEQLTRAVSNLLVTVEAYPDLKSNTNFLELQRQLVETEDRIAAGRRYYNANVRSYNTRIESFPTNIMANMFGFKRATYFEVNDAAVRQAPKVDFGGIGAGGAAQPSAQPGNPAIGQGSGNPVYETPNYSVRSGVQDGQPAVADPAQAGSQFGYTPPSAAQPPTPPPGYTPPAAQPQQGFGPQPGYTPPSATPPQGATPPPGYTPPQTQ